MDKSIHIYNSLSRKKDVFEPLDPSQISMYVCGPTVYDEPHIGHARSAYIFDVIRRYLIFKGYKVKFVRNVTDVDDKIINKAINEYKGEDIDAAVKKVADKYLASYHDSLESLEIGKDADMVEPKASEYISKMVDFIRILIEKGAAYPSGGDVYFDITKAKNYGKLSNQSLDKMEVGTRIASGENKKNPLDFALWKAAKENEPSWDSPWGRGRPGWHIECSVMSSDILGDEFDIHGGGIDLIFPHHENEIAQSEGAGKKFARIWIHHGLLTINGQKMSKSLGNFVTIKDALEKYHPDVLKIFFLQAHYSSPIDYSNNKMDEENQRYKSFVHLCELHKEYRKMNLNNALSIGDVGAIDQYEQNFKDAMDNDFNTPQALVVLEKLKSYAYSLMANDAIAANWAKFDYAVKKIIFLLSQVFGEHPNLADPIADLRLVTGDDGFKSVISESFKDTRLIDKMIEERIKLKKEKKYAEADKVRKSLEEKGIVLEDRKDGKTVWRWK